MDGSEVVKEFDDFEPEVKSLLAVFVLAVLFFVLILTASLLGCRKNFQMGFARGGSFAGMVIGSGSAAR